MQQTPSNLRYNEVTKNSNNNDLQEKIEFVSTLVSKLKILNTLCDIKKMIQRVRTLNDLLRQNPDKDAQCNAFVQFSLALECDGVI